MKYVIIFSLAWLFTACQADQIKEIKSEAFKTGADVLVEQNFGFLNGKNVGFITNHTATVGGRHLADVMHEAEEVNVVALFGPEHGIRGDAPAGARITFETDQATGLPVYSLYGDIHKPTPEMLEGVEVLVFDIQDVGARFYTYLTTMVMAMEAAAGKGIPFVVLDRPNPLGGELTDGFVREKEFESFVGYLPIPVVYGLTVGELARMVKEEGMAHGLSGLNLHIIEMQNWTRGMTWPDLGRDWTPPSPNIPDFETALIYPGACFFEGVSASEGRGTYAPFIQLGAPWADGEALAADLNARNLPGLQFQSVSFIPESIPGMAMNPSHLGSNVNGVRYVITDASVVRPVEAGIHVLHAFYSLAPESERKTFFNPPQAGRESRIGGPRKSAIVRLAGTDQLYKMLENGSDAEEIIQYWMDDLDAYDQLRRKYFLYP
ncbi:MAG: exo-beta-N-acetylmuramidase NamZ domain-containing protein [Cyclonatronaceae bacterium]